MKKGDALWRYFREVNKVVQTANAGDAAQPFKRGTFMVSALAGDVELVVKDICEEDAILIAAELNELGAKANISATLHCQDCGERVPAQTYCVNCRAKLSDA